MADQVTTVGMLKDAMQAFVAERDWQQFHSPKNLAMGLACECAELMEHFLWMNLDESRQQTADPAKREQIADELADVANYVLCLSHALDIDLSEAIARKLQKNAEKYPAEKFKGRYR